MTFKNERFSNIANTIAAASHRIQEATRRNVPPRPIAGPAMAKFMHERWGYTVIDVKEAGK